jgi:hypothetical protein
MKFLSSIKSWKSPILGLMTFVIVMLSAIPAWASGASGGGTAAVGEDATKNVVKVETQTPWFYWPGWAFVGLTALVLGFMAYSWYKFIFVPKYRGRKIAQ